MEAKFKHPVRLWHLRPKTKCDSQKKLSFISQACEHCYADRWSLISQGTLGHEDQKNVLLWNQQANAETYCPQLNTKLPSVGVRALLKAEHDSDFLRATYTEAAFHFQPRPHSHHTTCVKMSHGPQLNLTHPQLYYLRGNRMTVMSHGLGKQHRWSWVWLKQLQHRRETRMGVC